ncbi:outer membrane efflux protein BepC [Abditibacteriota bacterium]|nr:outer membrane efflux protein BepC [Abditibacteriota bacterium]
MKPFVLVAGALLLTSLGASSWAQTTPPDQTQAAPGTPAVNTPLGDAPGPSTGVATNGTQGTAGGSTTGLVPVPDYPTAGLADVRERQAADQPVLTLGDAVLQALRNNPTPQAARASVAAALARAGQAASAGKLQVNLSGSESNQRSIIGGNSSGTGTGTGTTVSTSNGLTGFLGGNSAEQLSLNATLPIYSGGRVKNSRKAAEAAARAQLLESQQTEQELAAQTILAYVSVLQNQELLQVANSNLDTSRERRRVAGVRYDAGAAARLEVLRADSDLSSAAQRRIASANGVAQSKAALNILLARAPETPVRVESIQTLVLPTFARFPLADQATAIANGGDIPTSPDLRAIADNSLPSLGASRERINAAEYTVDAQKAQKKPSIGASLTGLLRNPVGTVGRFLLTGGLSVAQVLLDGKRINSQVDEARASLDIARQNLTGQELQTANAIEGSLLSLDSALKRQTSAETAVLSAQEALRAAQLGYTAGAGTQLDVIDAQNALVSVQTDAVNARYQVAQAQVQLAAATAIVGSGSATGNSGLGSSAGTGQSSTVTSSGANQNSGSLGGTNTSTFNGSSSTGSTIGNTGIGNTNIGGTNSNF